MYVCVCACVRVEPVKKVDPCSVTATFHGPYVFGEHEVTGQYCESENEYVFVVYDGNHYKLTAVSLEDAKASNAPTTSKDKYYSAAKGSVDVEDTATVCNIWVGEGYKVETASGYELKNVKAICGSCIYVYVCMPECRSNTHELTHPLA